MRSWEYSFFLKVISDVDQGCAVSLYASALLQRSELQQPAGPACKRTYIPVSLRLVSKLNFVCPSDPTE